MKKEVKVLGAIAIVVSPQLSAQIIIETRFRAKE